MPLLCLGLSHHTAPLAVRERLAVGAGLPSALATDWLPAAVTHAGLAEFGVLSTCNRTELYAAARNSARPVPGAEALGDILRRLCQVPADFASPHLYFHRGLPAVRHLCRVAAGLDSMVVGEAEVLGQVAEAHQRAMQAGVAGPILDAAFRAAVRAGRRARSETGICRSPASLASEAVRLVRDVTPDLAHARVLVLGTGRMGRITAELLRAKGARDLSIVSRTAEHARDLAEVVGGTAVAWHDLSRALRDADVVVTATGAPHAVVTRELVAAALDGRTPGRRLMVVDIAVPRDVEPAVGDLPGVAVYDLDGLQPRVEANLAERRREVPRAEAIVEEEVARFEAWRRSAALRPVLAGLHSHAEAIRLRELERVLGRMGTADPVVRRELDALSRALVARLLDAPSRRLRREADPERSRGYAEAVRALFGLNGTEGTPGTGSGE
jgi:glutamyl-tRNA reductase